MIIGVFGSLVVGVLILFFAQKIKENRYKIIIRILGFLFLALPILVGLWNNYVAEIFNKPTSNTPVQENALESSIPSTPEITDWQTYSNSQYSFEIKYPNGTQITDIDAKTGWFFFSLPYSLDLQLDIRVNVGKACPSSDISYSDINGMKFIKTDKSNDFGGMEGRAIATDYCIVKNNKVYELITRLGYNRDNPPSQSDIQESSEIFNQIISTFGFIGETKRTEIMLDQMFPGVEIETAGFFGVQGDEIIEGNFLKPGKKSYLFVTRTSSGNPLGYDHAYLGIFDENDKLQTSFISKTEVPIDHGISLNPPYFGGDDVQFEFYNCKDATLISVNVKECLTGGATTCVDSGNLLLKLVNNKFEIVQNFLEEVQPKNTLAYPTKEGIRLYNYVEKNKLPANFQCIDKKECLGDAVEGPEKEFFLIFSQEIPFDLGICKFK